MASFTFSVFANALAQELGTDNYLCLTSFDDAVVTVLLGGREPVVTLCIKESVAKTCSVWKALLNDDSMLRHVSCCLVFAKSL